MAIKTILFDLDGTLVDSSSDIAAAFQYAWRSVVGGIPPSTTMIARHIGKPLTEMVSELGGELSPSLLSTFLTVYQQTYRNRNGRLTRLYPEVISSLEALSAFTLGIVTTKESDQAEMILQRLSLMSFSNTSRVVHTNCRSSRHPAPSLRLWTHYNVNRRTR